ncbi:voltage-dependent calcium channel subunit alpha-2/delta-3 isoform X3 [Zootermopsis nevadensis]|uniref:Voltage-dependent calcium channel subunit alpha-2/delta-3 n=1 Tax=Zootermopsis nevadensis TaxID=136037 RepID=A0A067RGR1_ZOONE|nr:voltage-dependent calcium channel subunit alpha-2/delta-3 isoform X3 [Zootermopsis nevadensis]KDR23041.1 Voltage-dependent calcium channel subunit alpha-2/delta-3 [Zootermopsis nevadensis]
MTVFRLVSAMHLVIIITALILLCSSPANVWSSYGSQERISGSTVHNWAGKLGGELWHLGEYVTSREEIQKNYKSAQVNRKDGNSLVREIANDIKNMTDLKISAVKRIMDSAEATAVSQQDEVVTEYEYYNTKTLRPPGEPLEKGAKEMILTPNKHFYNIPVNTSHSAVHVPTNVYDQAPDILKDIKWSENLNEIFIRNYQDDPSLSWQYFGSSSGFMRQYPAMQWRNDSVDLYDCRTRSWYIEAAASPKDMLILVDNSGSMTGIRKEIARHVVSNILDTLGNNDFVNIFNFSEEIDEVVPCFKDMLVQANLANVREFKQGMKDLHTDKIANFSAVLSKAFELLQQYRETKKGACCNQAIMLITDGVPYNYKEIFEEYNWKNFPNMPVRVFTYLIGREVTDVREVKWMACANRGYYVPLSTLAEVREQVLHYIPVMARPLVLTKTEHPINWTPVYADITDPKMTDWLWEKRVCTEQKEIYETYFRDRFHNNHISNEEHDRRYVQKIRRAMDNDEESEDYQKYQLMTSVSMPVFDQRENATKIARLLGVAGTDVPIQDIQKLMMPHKLGVNGYAFIITNNGYILTHPDLRPVFQGILKPSYNSVDMAEVELVDDHREARDINPKLREFRSDVINQSTGATTLEVKYYYDDMKRVSHTKRHYYYTGIENTPFTLVIALPDHYGLVSVNAQVEIRRQYAEGVNVSQFFQGDNWRIHPEWTYCKYHYDSEHEFPTPEAEFRHFLVRTGNPNWKWLSKRSVTPPEHVEQSNTSGGKSEKLDKDSYFCDRELFLSLIFDGRATEWFSNRNMSSNQDSKKEFQQRFGVTIAFVATHSGLTRWQEFPGEENRGQPRFGDVHNRALDEIWYKRAVEQHYVDEESFVYSVPFDDGEGYRNETLVTASHAIFSHKAQPDNKMYRSPVAVVGFQFRHMSLHALFKNITSTCDSCRLTCDSDELECYVLDNNGYIIVSESLRDTGKFFGEVQGNIMEMMVEEGLYKRIHMFDYQAVCFREDATKSKAPFLITPLTHLKWMLEWFIGNIVWLLVESNFKFLWHLSWAFASEDDYHDGFDIPTDITFVEILEEQNMKPTEPPYEKLQINRTRPEPCDKEVDLYQLQSHSDQVFSKRADEGCVRPFVVQKISFSNMILVVVDTLCTFPEEKKLSITPDEVRYNSSLACFKVHSDLPQKRPTSCIKQHPKEQEIELCGHSSRVEVSVLPFLLCWLVTFLLGTEH